MPKGKTTTRECEICQKQISLFAYTRHIKSHNTVKVVYVPVNNNPGDCKYCFKSYKTQSALHNHEIRCKLNEFKIINNLTDAGRLKISEVSKSIVWTEERKLRHSISMKLAVINNPDSYSSNNVCGRVKIEEYKGVKFHGKWELSVVIWLDLQNIKWDRTVTPFNYFWNGKWHLYFPDFYLPDLDIYIEVKGYEIERDRCKWKVVKNLIVIKQKEISQIRNNSYMLR